MIEMMSFAPMPYRGDKPTGGLDPLPYRIGQTRRYAFRGKSFRAARENFRLGNKIPRFMGL